MNKDNKTGEEPALIYTRQAVRSYKKQHINHDVIENLLTAATYAPTAMHQDACLFTVIQDHDLLKRISDSAKKLLAKERADQTSPLHHRSMDYLTSPKFNIFYNADALVIICGESEKPFIEADCWLAAENLMLAACNVGIGSCVIGLAVKILNSEEWKKELKIAENVTVFAPIILGYPDGETPATSRKKPNVTFRK
jgi:nitroreductase